uniref:Myosin-related n=1 Tax=Zea mays TaxID=4577 RepID=A0A804LG74_MAIZE
MSARRAAKSQHAAATPRIINFNLARRSGGGRPSRAAGRAQPRPPAPPAGPVNLGALFEMERRARGLESAPASPPCSRAVLRSQEDAEEQEEKWRFQAEILRAECNFLRMEREVALRKLDRHRGQMEAALKSAVETLVSGRKKIDGKGDVGLAATLDEGIEDLEEMMEELRVEESGRRAMSGVRELQRSHGRNFDRQASSLRRRLEKMTPADPEPCIKDIREIALPVPAPPPPPAERSDDDERVHGANTPDVEMLRMKMEGMSKGMRERMAEYSRRLEAVASGDNTGCESGKCGNRHSRKASASSQRSWSGGSTASNGNAPSTLDAGPHGRSRQNVAAEKRQQQQTQIMAGECKLVGSASCCHCREIVWKVMEQVKAESDQWTEMQEMLEQVRLEMQELQASRDAWQHRAMASDISLRSLNSQVLEWKNRAQASEQRVEELHREILELESKLHTFKAHLPAPAAIPNQKQWSDACKMEYPRAKPQHPRSQESGKEEIKKHVLICRVKRSPSSVLSKRSPFQEIGNISLPRH